MRCKAKTKKGKRCKRPAMKDSDFCYNHHVKNKDKIKKCAKKRGGKLKIRYTAWQKELAAVLDDHSYKSQLKLIKMGLLRSTKEKKKMEKADEYLVIKWIKLRHETLVAMDRAEGVGVDVKLTVVDYGD